MPVHDWSHISSGLFHHFHQHWIGALSDALNSGLLPDQYFALAEQSTGGVFPDVIALENSPKEPANPPSPGGFVVAEAPPKAWTIRQAEEDVYATRADRIGIYHPLGQLVAVLEILSPGNNARRAALRSLVRHSILALHSLERHHGVSHPLRREPPWNG